MAANMDSEFVMTSSTQLSSIFENALDATAAREAAAGTASRTAIDDFEISDPELR